MGVKGHGGGLKAGLVSALTGPSQERAVAQMDPVEETQCNYASVQVVLTSKKLFSVANRPSHSRPSIKNAPDWL